MGKFFTIHRAGKEAMKNFFAVSFFILLIAAVGGLIVWFLMVKPLQDKVKDQPKPKTEQVAPPKTNKPEVPSSSKPKEEKKPWEKDEESDKEKPKSNQINKLF